MSLPHLPEASKDAAIEALRLLMHKYYCENDTGFLVDLFDDSIVWFSAGKRDFKTSREALANSFRQFAGQVAPCIIVEESYDAIEIAAEAYLCFGRAVICTAPSTGVRLEAHKRVSAVIRWADGRPRCCHVHISSPNPDIREGYSGLSAQARDPQELWDVQAAELSSIYDTVPCAVMRLIRCAGRYRLLTFNKTLARILQKSHMEIMTADWSRGFLNNVFPEDVALLEDIFCRTKKPGDSANATFRILTADGRLKHIYGNLTMIREDERGQILQFNAFDVSKRIRAENALSRLSFIDSLSGLFNRNRFNMDLARFAKKQSLQLGVACFDLNGLKQINDKFGHSAGDRLIQCAAASIWRAFPDRTYRVGGDEFVVLDETLDQPCFQRGVQDVCKELSAQQISISVGTSWRSQNCDVHDQLEEADAQMYLEKKHYYRKNARTPQGDQGPSSLPDMDIL